MAVGVVREETASGVSERTMRWLGIKVFLRSLLCMAGVGLAEIIGLVLAQAFGGEGGDETVAGIAIYMCVGAMGAVLGMLAMGGRSWISTSREDLSTTFRFGWWCLALSVSLALIGTIGSLVDGDPISPDWYATAPLVILICLAIGVVEEFLFRGIVFNALLALMGKTHRGLMVAIAITSVLFGLAHIDVTTDFADPVLAGQAVLKIAQTGMYSVLLCTIVLRTHKLGGVSLFHGLDDLALMLPSIALFGGSVNTDYVQTGDDGLISIVFYLVMCALYLPFFLKCLKALKQDGDVYRGVFMERALERRAKREARESSGPALPGKHMRDESSW